MYKYQFKTLKHLTNIHIIPNKYHSFVLMNVICPMIMKFLIWMCTSRLFFVIIFSNSVFETVENGML